jgi:hypothetical protein
LHTAGAASIQWYATMHPDNPLAPYEPARLFPGDLVDEREAAAILGCAVQSLRNWRWSGKPPRYYKCGQRLVRYHVRDLQAFIEGKADAA